MRILNLKEKGNSSISGLYYGKVSVIEDPMKQGRIKVQLPEVFGDSEPKDTPWIYPIGYNSGVRLFNVPDLDTEVGIVFLNDVYTGFYGIGKYSKGEQKIFDEDYPNLYGIEDLQGNQLTINKKTGVVKFHHLSNTELTIDKDGNVSGKITGMLNVEVAKDVQLKAVNVNIKASGTVTVDAPKTELGKGGPKIARVGDKVQVGDKVGSIISGGTNTSI